MHSYNQLKMTIFSHFTAIFVHFMAKNHSKIIFLSEKLHNLPFSTMLYNIQSFLKKFEKLFWKSIFWPPFLSPKKSIFKKFFQIFFKMVGCCRAWSKTVNYAIFPIKKIIFEWFLTIKCAKIAVKWLKMVIFKWL